MANSSIGTFEPPLSSADLHFWFRAPGCRRPGERTRMLSPHDSPALTDAVPSWSPLGVGHLVEYLVASHSSRGHLESRSMVRQEKSGSAKRPSWRGTQNRECCASV